MKPTLDSRQLHAFAALARRGSFTLAAKELFLTQSAISHAIKALEGDLGCRLFDRIGRRVKLTPPGEQFRLHAEKILREMQLARQNVEAVTNAPNGRLRVGASTTACQHVLAPVLARFRERFDDCALRVEPGDHREQVELLRAGRVDLALMIEPPRSGDFEFHPLFDDELRFIVGCRHRWASMPAVPRDEIEDETLVLYHRASYTFRLVDEYFREDGIALKNVIELGSTEAMKELAKIGVGPAVLAAWTARPELDAGTLVSLPLGRRPLRRRWGIAHLRERAMTAAEEAFLELCREFCASFTAVERSAA